MNYTAISIERDRTDGLDDIDVLIGTMDENGVVWALGSVFLTTDRAGRVVPVSGDVRFTASHQVEDHVMTEPDPALRTWMLETILDVACKAVEHWYRCCVRGVQCTGCEQCA